MLASLVNRSVSRICSLNFSQWIYSTPKPNFRLNWVKLIFRQNSTLDDKIKHTYVYIAVKLNLKEYITIIEIVFQGVPIIQHVPKINWQEISYYTPKQAFINLWSTGIMNNRGLTIQWILFHNQSLVCKCMVEPFIDQMENICMYRYWEWHLDP